MAVWDCDDARGLLKSAVRDNNPTLVLESERMYGVEFECSDEVMDKNYMVPIGKARMHMEGDHVTLLSYAAGADQWKAALIGSVSAAIQIGRVGNLPISEKELLDFLFS